MVWCLLQLSIRDRWVGFALLFTLVPVSLLVGFRLTGILQEPQTSKTITVETATWNMSRPIETGEVYVTFINETISDSYTDGKASVGLGTHIVWYHENDPSPPFDLGEGDGLDMRVVSTLNVTEGFIHSVVIRFSRTGDDAFLEMSESPEFFQLYNVSLGAIRNWGIHDWEKESYIEVYGVNQPKYCRLAVQIDWVFLDVKNNLDHRMTIDLEATYFDGATYRKVIAPILLEVLT